MNWVVVRATEIIHPLASALRGDPGAPGRRRGKGEGIFTRVPQWVTSWIVIRAMEIFRLVPALRLGQKAAQKVVGPVFSTFYFPPSTFSPKARVDQPHDLQRGKGPYRFDVPKTAVRWPVFLPLAVILLVSLLIRAFDVDRQVSSLSYDHERNYWPFARAEPWLAFYRYGIYPPMVLGLLGLLAIVTGRWTFPLTGSRRSNTVRREGLFLALMLLIGPGLLVNVGLKSLWGRPRPLQCAEFGGAMGFKPVGEISTQKFPNSSFPSGHAATAFYFFAPAFIVGPNRPRVRRRWLLAGIGYGSAMGFTRVLQGGHFLSDVLWAGIIVYFVGVALSRILLRQEFDDVEVEQSSLHGTISMASTS